MKSFLDDFRMNLKFYREQCHFSQSELAIQADCSNGLIGNIEAGKVKPSFDTILKLSSALKIHPADLFLRNASKSKTEFFIILKNKIANEIQSLIDENMA